MSSAASTRSAAPKIDNMYHAGWAWAGDTPFQSHQADRLAFRRHAQPDGRSRGRQRIKPDKTPRPQFHHVNDIVPTIYEILGIKPPKVVDGFEQDPDRRRQHGLHLRRRQAPTRKHTQYFDNNGSRGIYHDGWYACTFGPLVPWDTPVQSRSSPTGIRPRTSGSSTTSRRTSRRPTISPQKEPERLAR